MIYLNYQFNVKEMGYIITFYCNGEYVKAIIYRDIRYMSFDAFITQITNQVEYPDSMNGLALKAFYEAFTDILRDNLLVNPID